MWVLRQKPHDKSTEPWIQVPNSVIVKGDTIRILSEEVAPALVEPILSPEEQAKLEDYGPLKDEDKKSMQVKRGEKI